MAVEYFPDGIKVGIEAPGGSDNDRLPIFEIDEWVDYIDPGTMTAGEVKTFVIQNVANLRFGAVILAARPQNVSAPELNYDKLLVLHAYCSNDGEITVMLKNIHNDTVQFGHDQWLFPHWNTSNPNPPPLP